MDLDENSHNNQKLFKLTFSAILVGLAFILNFLEIPLSLPVLPFLTVNLSLLALIIVQYYSGFLFGFLSLITYTILSFCFSFISSGGLIGVIAHFLGYFIYFLLFELFLRLGTLNFKKINLKFIFWNIFSFVIIITLSALWMTAMNYFFLLKLWGMGWKSIFFVWFFSFNLIQFSINSLFIWLFILFLKRILK